MKLKKILLSILATSFFASSAFAGSALVKVTSPHDAKVHAINITNTGKRTVQNKVTIYVGTLQNGLCYPGPSETPIYLSSGPAVSTTFDINGDVLRDDFGLRYDCGVVVLENDWQTRKDAFTLMHDGYTYYRSYPMYSDMYVN